MIKPPKKCIISIAYSRLTLSYEPNGRWRVENVIPDYMMSRRRRFVLARSYTHFMDIKMCNDILINCV